MNCEAAKVRVPNFTASEKMHLMQIIANKYGSILEDKKTDRLSATQKENAWKSIENEFNASSTNNAFRKASCLKKCYENRKKELRKSLAEERKESILTGGGPKKKLKKDESDDILRSILNEKTLVGLTNPFDDDADVSAIEFIQDDNIEVEYVYNEEGRNADTSEVLPSTSIETENSNIKKTNCNSNEDAEKNNWKKYTGNKLRTPISTPLTFTECASEQNISKTPKASSRRRPTTIVKPMTSSDFAKKYDILLDKRITLVDAQLVHMQRHNDKIIKKLDLEIEILNIELAKKKGQN